MVAAPPPRLRHLIAIGKVAFGVVVVLVAARFVYLAAGSLLASSKSPAVTPFGQPEQVAFRQTIPALLADERESVSAVFSLDNTTDRPLKLGPVRRSCACTDATLDRDTIPPGESAHLTMTVRVAGQSGTHQVMGLIDADGGQTWRCELAFTIVPVAFFPQSTLAFGIVAPGGTIMKDVTFETAARTREELPAIEVVSSAGEVTAMVADEAVVEDLAQHFWRKAATIRVTASPATGGRESATILAVCKYADGRSSDCSAFVGWTLADSAR